MRLYSYWRSSSAWRVRIALCFKNIDCEIVPVHVLRDGGQQHAADFLARNPMAQVPVLEEDTAAGLFRLTQSMAILEYLEERYPDPPLLPRDPATRARARQLAEIVNSGIQPLQNLKLRQELVARGMDAVALSHQFNLVGLNALEEASRTSAGRFLVGDDISFADVLLVPQLHASRRLGVDVEAFPTLRRVERACEEHPAFQAAHPDAQPDREP